MASRRRRIASSRRSTEVSVNKLSHDESCVSLTRHHWLLFKQVYCKRSYPKTNVVSQG